MRKSKQKYPKTCTCGGKLEYSKFVGRVFSVCPNCSHWPVTQSMVDSFLTWRLPENFAPDCGISFKKPDRPYTESAWWPTGTNLFDATQARAMLEYVLGEAEPEAPAATGMQCIKCGDDLYSNDDIVHGDKTYLVAHRKCTEAPAPQAESEMEFFCDKHRPNSSRKYTGCLVCSRNEDYQMVCDFLRALGWAKDKESQLWARDSEEGSIFSTSEAVTRAIADYDGLREAHKKSRLYAASQQRRAEIAGAAHGQVERTSQPSRPVEAQPTLSELQERARRELTSPNGEHTAASVTDGWWTMDEDTLVRIMADFAFAAHLKGE